VTLDDYRRDFETTGKRSLSMPISGAVVWLAVAVISLQVSQRTGLLILFFLSGAIFPLALWIAKFRGEKIFTSNPLAKLMALSVLMVNLLWAVHIPLLIYAPAFVPLSLGIGLGLHWIVYSWIVQHPLGTIHTILRTILVTLAWWSFPNQRLFAVGLAIALVYAISIYQMSTRPLLASDSRR
jgi:hypothetical protein